MNLREVFHGVLHGQSHEPGGFDELYGTVPVGTGVWWYGTLAMLAAKYPNWKVVDGTVVVNGLTPPDMRDKVPIAAGTTYALGDLVGTATVTPSAHAGAAVGNHAFTQPGAHATHAAHGTLLTEVQSGTGKNVTEFNGANEANHAAHTANHTGGAVDAHAVTQPSAHSALSTLQPSVAWRFIVRVR